MMSVSLTNGENCPCPSKMRNNKCKENASCEVLSRRQYRRSWIEAIGMSKVMHISLP